MGDSVPQKETKSSSSRESVSEIESGVEWMRTHLVRIAHSNTRNIEAWRTLAQFERRNGDIKKARQAYNSAALLNPNHGDLPILLSKFAEFEEKNKEENLARKVYKYLLEYYRRPIRSTYEAKVLFDPHDYDTWKSLVEMEENGFDYEIIRDLYESAVRNLPATKEKAHWAKYYFLWIKYARFEEIRARGVEGSRKIYWRCLDLMTNQAFSFSAVWILAFNFEKRQSDRMGARDIFERALRLPPNLLRPQQQVWKYYTEFEIAEGDYSRARQLFERRLDTTHGVDVWLSYADFEASVPGEKTSCILKARSVLQRAMTKYRNGEYEKETELIVEKWMEIFFS